MRNSAVWFCATIVTIALGCGGDDNNNTPYSGDNVCEKAPDKDITWTYSGSDPICQIAVAGLNEPDDEEDESECAMGAGAFVLVEGDGKCIASIAAECDGAEFSIVCAVDASGKGDCSAELEGTVQGQNVDCTFSGKAQ